MAPGENMTIKPFANNEEAAIQRLVSPFGGRNFALSNGYGIGLRGTRPRTQTKNSTP